MPPVDLRIRALRIPMRSRLKQASSERKTSDSVWVEARRGAHVGVGEGCPRPYVTGEHTDSAVEWLSGLRVPESFEALQAFVSSNAADLDVHAAAWCAAETALLDLFARERGVSIEALLGVSEARDVFPYTAVVSDEQGEALDKLLMRYLEAGFSDFKLKLAGELEADAMKLSRLRELAAEAPLRIRLDANNVWGEDAATAIARLGALRSHGWFAVEEPLTARRADDLSRIAGELETSIILDECLCRLSDVALYRGKPGRFIANVKVSKAGGLMRALPLIAAARAEGWPVIIGAQVGETSVLTRAGLVAARAAGESLLAVEGGFGTLLLEHDLVEPVLMFGFGGQLTVSDVLPAGSAGLGLRLLEGTAS